MEFQTHLQQTKRQHHRINYHSKILLFGSCFAEHIHDKFRFYQFQSNHNPFGVLFHPLAIENLVRRAINKEEYTEADLCNNSDLWLTFDAHSRVRSAEKMSLLNSLNQKLRQTHQNIQNATHVIISLGSAWVYRHIALDRIVANCHKFPQKLFSKELLPIQSISASLEAIVDLIYSVNPAAKIIVTVSPVRHIKDGIVENNRSKAHLLTSVHNLVESQKHCFYFPSYELMMDELRDYRFYKRDMVHPNDLAIDIIWDRFKDEWIEDDTYYTMKAVASIQKRLQHKPLNPGSTSHKIFLKQLKADILALESKSDIIRFPT